MLMDFHFGKARGGLGGLKLDEIDAGAPDGSKWFQMAVKRPVKMSKKSVKKHHVLVFFRYPSMFFLYFSTSHIAQKMAGCSTI